MALTTFNPDPAPSPGTKTKPAFKLKKAEFGDGYTQTTRDGLNHARRTVTLTWELLTEAQADALEAYFNARGGDQPFYYTRRNDIQRKYTCEDFERTNGSPNTFTATLVESFSLET